MKKELVSRFSVSLPPRLLKQFDAMTGEKGYAKRSQAVADMIRDKLVEHQQQFSSADIAGTITLVYDHHQSHVQASLTEIQHEHHEVIISTVHVHLDHHNCLEVLIVHGKSAEVEQFADRLMGLKGVQHGRLVKTVPAHGMDTGRKTAHKRAHKHPH